MTLRSNVHIPAIQIQIQRNLLQSISYDLRKVNTSKRVYSRFARRLTVS